MRHHRYRRWAVRARLAAPTGAAVLVFVVVLCVPAAAYATTTGGVPVGAVKSLPQVIAGLQAWVMGILAALASLYLVLAGVYRLTAGGDPAQIDRAREAFRNALVGYGLAVLSPVLLGVVKSIVGG